MEWLRNENVLELCVNVQSVRLVGANLVFARWNRNTPPGDRKDHPNERFAFHLFR